MALSAAATIGNGGADGLVLVVGRGDAVVGAVTCKQYVARGDCAEFVAQIKADTVTSGNVDDLVGIIVSGGP